MEGQRKDGLKNEMIGKKRGAREGEVERGKNDRKKIRGEKDGV